MSRTSTIHRTVRTVRGPVARLPRPLLALLRLRRADVDLPAPEREGTEMCVAGTCPVTKAEADKVFHLDGAAYTGNPRDLPYTKAELAACEVPAQDERTSDLQSTRQVRDARPDLAPVWCPQGCGWFHSAPCYSTHHHAGWEPARGAPDRRRTKVHA